MPRWLLVTLSALYVLSPVDLIPDVIPIVGWLDDIGVLGFLVHSLMNPKQLSDS